MRITDGNGGLSISILIGIFAMAMSVGRWLARNEESAYVITPSFNVDEKVAMNDLDAVKALALYEMLTFLQESNPKKIEYEPPNKHSRRAETLLTKAMENSNADTNNCDAQIWFGLLKLTQGNFKAAAEKFERAGSQSSDKTCTARRDLYIGIILELKGDNERARELYKEARQGDERIHENFFDREYTATDPPNLKVDLFASSMVKLGAFRVYYEAFFKLRNEANAMEFSHESPERGGVHIRGGTRYLEEAKDLLDRNGFVVLRGFLTQWETKTLHQIYVYLLEIKEITNFDNNLARTITYNDRLSHFLGHLFTDHMSVIGGRSLKHVYSFLCWHSVREESKHRPRLLPHTDREDNEYTLSLQMHFNDTSGKTAWPIWVHTKKVQNPKAGWQTKPPDSESVKLRFADGDAILFRGREHIHWRNEMPITGVTFSSMLLHYVHKEWDWKNFKEVRQKQDASI